GAAGLDTMAGDLLAAPAVDDFYGARQAYARALERAPGYAPAVEAAAALYERYGDYESATQLLELQSEIDDVDRRADYLARLGRLYQELGQFDNQVSALRRASELQPDDVVLLFRLEELLADLGRPRERVEVLRQIAA